MDFEDLVAAEGSIFNVSSNNFNSTTSGRDEDLAKIEQLVLAVIFVLTLLGNGLVILGIFYRRQKMSRMYYFMLHLAIADLTTAFFQVLPQFIWEITFRFQGGAFLCKFVKYTQILGPYASSFILVATALDRYKAICFPLSNYTWTSRKSKRSLFAAWTIALLCCTPQLYIFSYQDVSGGVGTPAYDCWGTFAEGWGEKAYITWYCFSVFIIPLLILSFSYICICRVVWLNASMKLKVNREQSSILIKPNKLKGGKQHKNLRKRRNNSSSSDEDIEEEDDEKGKDGHKGKQIAINKNFQNEKLGNENRNGEHSSSKPFKVSWKQNKNQDESESNMSPLNNRSWSKKSTSVSLCPNDDDGEVKQGLLPNTEASKLADDVIQEVGGGAATCIDQKTKRQRENCSVQLNNELKSEGGSKTTLSLSPQSPRPSPSPPVAVAAAYSQPRTSSVRGISRAKIKTVKLTVTVVCCFILCSTPFIGALLWSVYDPYAREHPFFYGPTFTILTLLASLNSCANAWIMLFFNPHLLKSLASGLCCRHDRNKRDEEGFYKNSTSMKHSQCSTNNNAGGRQELTSSRKYVNVSFARKLATTNNSSSSQMPSTTTFSTTVIT